MYGEDAGRTHSDGFVQFHLQLEWRALCVCVYYLQIHICVGLKCSTLSENNSFLITKLRGHQESLGEMVLKC